MLHNLFYFPQNVISANYGPISILTAFSKVLEKIIDRRLFNHILDNNILVNEQFGFYLKSSTVVASYNLINAILQALNNKTKVGGFFLF
jgi:hypothetical protein